LPLEVVDVLEHKLLLARVLAIRRRRTGDVEVHEELHLRVSRPFFDLWSNLRLFFGRHAVGLGNLMGLFFLRHVF
jgi:hypothetical protein